MIGEVVVNFGQNVNHKCMEKKNLLHFSPPLPLNTVGYLYETKAEVMYVYFLRIELVVKLVFEVKRQNLARENDPLAWSTEMLIDTLGCSCCRVRFDSPLVNT